MNNLKVIFLMGIAILLSGNLMAQKPDGARRGPGPERGNQLEHLKKNLDLSADQVSALEPIFKETREKMMALRDQEFDSREARMEAMKTIQDATKEKVNAILTEEQVAKMEALRKERPRRPQRTRGERGERGERGAFRENRQDLREELKAYHNENVLPVLLAQRQKLELQLSEDDKATIASLRANRAEMAEKRKSAFENRERRGAPSEEQKAAIRANMESIKALLEKHDSAIEGLFAEVEPDAEAWKTDIKAIVEKYKPEDAPTKKAKAADMRRAKKRVKGAKQSRIEGQKAILHKARFLLMDPSGDQGNNLIEESPFELEAYPNPANSNTTINYTIQNSGKVSIVLRNKAGNINRVLFSGNKNPGEYSLDIDTSNLQGGTYFYTISNDNGDLPVTKQLVITK